MARLKRTLSLGSVVLFGIAYMTPSSSSGLSASSPRPPRDTSPPPTSPLPWRCSSPPSATGAWPRPSRGRLGLYLRAQGHRFPARLHRRLGGAARLPVPADGDLADRRRLPALGLSRGTQRGLGAGVHRRDHDDQHRRPAPGEERQWPADAGAVPGPRRLRRTLRALRAGRPGQAVMVTATVARWRPAGAAGDERCGDRLLLVPRVSTRSVP